MSTPAILSPYRQLAPLSRILQESVPLRPNPSNPAHRQPTAYVSVPTLTKALAAQTPQTPQTPQTQIQAADTYNELLDALLTNPPEGLFVPLSYLEGFPTIEGAPFWEQLNGEPPECYSLFELYLVIPYLQSSKATKATKRSLQEVARRSSASAQPPAIAQLYDIGTVFHWPLRANAYDSYHQQQTDHLRESLTLSMEAEHQTTARSLFKICSEFIQKNQASLTPTSALKWFEAAVRLERLSLGLPPDKPAASEEAAAAAVQINHMQINPNYPNPQTNAGRLDQASAYYTEVFTILQTSGALIQHQQLPTNGGAHQEVIDVSATPKGVQ